MELSTIEKLPATFEQPLLLMRFHGDLAQLPPSSNRRRIGGRFPRGWTRHRLDARNRGAPRTFCRLRTSAG